MNNKLGTRAREKAKMTWYQKGEKPILQSSEVSQYNKTIGLMGQACYQAVQNASTVGEII